MIFFNGLLQGFFAGVFAGAVLVWFYNRYLFGLRESWIKKSLSLATLPVAILAGVGHAVAVWYDWPHLILPVIGGVVVVCLRWIGWRRCIRNNRGLERERIMERGSGLAFPWYSPPVRTTLRLLRPINDVDALEVVSRDIPMKGLHRDLDGYRVVFLTDFHIHPTLSEDYFRRIVEVALGRDADLMLIGGDFVSRRWHLPLAAKLLRPLWSHPNVYMVRGNHDFWTRPSFMAREVKRHDVWLLSNDFALQRRGEGAFALVGIEDPYIPLTGREEERLHGALPGGIPRLGLVHTPESFPLAHRLGCQATLAGHTHGGQIRLPFFGTTVASVSAREELIFGIGNYDGMMTWTSNGLGAFYPVRFNCPPQMIEATLRVANGR